MSSGGPSFRVPPGARNACEEDLAVRAAAKLLVKLADVAELVRRLSPWCVGWAPWGRRQPQPCRTRHAIVSSRVAADVARSVVSGNRRVGAQTGVVLRRRNLRVHVRRVKSCHARPWGGRLPRAPRSWKANESVPGADPGNARSRGANVADRIEPRPVPHVYMCNAEATLPCEHDTQGLH